MKKVAFVSGATGNLGQAVAEHFLYHHYTVCGTTHNEGPQNANGIELKKIDLLDGHATEDYLKEIISRHHQIDVAVLTVGGFQTGSLEKVTTEDMEKQWELNFKTAFNALKSIYSAMKAKGYGRIFLIGSLAGRQMDDGLGAVAYALSKSLLFRLSELINAEMKEKNVSSIVVVPSILDTPQNRKAMPDADFSKWTPPSEVAEKVFQIADNQVKPSDANPILMV